jgi:uncharacterized protein (TIGR00725 family)
MARKLQIAVIGDNNPPPEVMRWAEEIGRRIAEHDAVVVCGGLGGVMAAAAQGAAAVGGLTVGILPSYDAATANPAISVTVVSGMGHGRNVLVAASGDAVIALPGSYGTLSEVALALKLGRTVIGLQAWSDIRGVQTAQTPAEAVTLALAAAHSITD